MPKVPTMRLSKAVCDVIGLVEDLKKTGIITLPETNSSHLKIGHPKRKLVFQPSIFRCYVSFREGKLPILGGIQLDAHVAGKFELFSIF